MRKLRNPLKLGIVNVRPCGVPSPTVNVTSSGLATILRPHSPIVPQGVRKLIRSVSLLPSELGDGGWYHTAKECPGTWWTAAAKCVKPNVDRSASPASPSVPDTNVNWPL